MTEDGISVTITAATVPALRERLLALAAALDAGPTPTAAATAPGKAGAPVCPIHKRPMAPSTKPGFAWYCKGKNDDGTWCGEGG